MFVVATANRIEGLPPGAAAQGAVRRDLLHRPARRRRAPGDPPHPPVAARARSRELRPRRRWPRGPSSSAAPRSSRRWWRVSTPRSTPAPSSPTFTSPSAISETVPLAVTLREEISRIRAWAADRTRPGLPAGEPGESSSPASSGSSARVPRPEPARHTTGERFEAIEPPAPLPEVQSDLAGAVRASGRRRRSSSQPRSDAQPFVRCPVLRPRLGAGRAPVRLRHRAGHARGGVLQHRALGPSSPERSRHEAEQHAIAPPRPRGGAGADAGTAGARRGHCPGGGRPGAGPGTRLGLAGALLLLAVLAVLLLPRGTAWPGRLRAPPRRRGRMRRDAGRGSALAPGARPGDEPASRTEQHEHIAGVSCRSMRASFTLPHHAAIS